MKIDHGIIAHLIDPRQVASLREPFRRVQEGTSAVLLQSGLDERWWSDSMECYCYLRNVQDLLVDGTGGVRKTIRRTIQRANNTFWSSGRISSEFREQKKYYLESFLAMS